MHHLSLFFVFGVLPFLLHAQNTGLEHSHSTMETFEFQKEGQKGQDLLFQFQDSRGFIWGADKKRGPMRFDGHTLESFLNDTDDSTTAPSGRIVDMRSLFFEDSKKHIWMVYGNSLERYDPAQETFEHFHPRLKEAVGGKYVSRVMDIYEDQQGDYWMAAGKWIFHYEVALDSIHAFPMSNYTSLVFEDPEGNIWCHVQYEDLIRINRTTGSVEERVPYPDYLKPNFTFQWAGGYSDRRFQIKANGTQILVVRGLMFEFDPVKRNLRSLHHAPLSPEDLVYYAHRMQDSTFLMATTGRPLLQYSYKEQRFMEPDIFQEGGLADEFNLFGPLTILQTNEGIIWINCLQFDGRWQNIRLFPEQLHLTNIPIPKEVLSSNINFTPTDYSFFLNNEPYFFTQPWITPFFPKNQKKKKLDLLIPELADRASISCQFATAPNGHLWQVATMKRGSATLYVREFNREGELIKTHFSLNEAGMTEEEIKESRALWSGGVVWDAKFDQQGVLWVGLLFGGLFSYDPSDGALRNFKDDFEQQIPMIRALWIDQDNQIWCGSNEGLHKWDPKTEVMTHFPPEKIKGPISTLVRDTTGKLWIGTFDGLFAMDISTGKVRQYGKREKFDGTSVNNIFLDKHQQVWVISEDQLYVFAPDKDQFFVFGPEDGVAPNQIDGFHLYSINDEGTVLMQSTASDVYLFSPQQIRIQPDVPEIYFTGLQVFNEKVKVAKKDVLENALDFTSAFTLKYSQNDFTIHFSAPEFAHPDQLEFWVRMKGFDEGWQNLGNQRKIRYTNLSPGNYTFQVKLLDQNGFESPTPRQTQIIILPPWYRTWWAILLWCLLGGSAILGIYRIQLRRRLALAEAARLKELEKAKTQLYTNVTHEFRTPLTVILGMVDQIKSDPKTWLGEGVQLIGRNGKQLLRLIDQLLDLAKLESGQLPLNLEQSDVVKYVHYLTESFFSFADSKDIRIHFNSPVETLLMDYDAEKLQHILSNLLSNAIKFTPPGGDVYVQLDPGAENREMILTVRDTGHGIAQEHLPHIFDRFYQADSSAVRQGEGTGIGLALTRELVQLMDGRIRVESNTNSERGRRGTTFILKLPITRKARPGESPMMEENEKIDIVQTATTFLDLQKKYSILLVEDNPDLITYISSVLSGSYHIETACNGKEGIATALETIPDLIISDVMMPITDGFELCQHLKTDEQTSHIPIILLTAKADQSAKIEGLRHGADAYLTKPFHKEELLVRVEKLIHQRQLLRERFQQAGSLRSLLHLPPSTIDDSFLQKVIGIIEKNLGNEEFGMPQLCKDLHMSRSNLFRKLKALTGKSATDLIRIIRLETAKELLEKTDKSISEISYAVGLNNPNYFSTIFKGAFGVPPSEIRKKGELD